MTATERLALGASYNPVAGSRQLAVRRAECSMCGAVLPLARMEPSTFGGRVCADRGTCEGRARRNGRRP